MLQAANRILPAAHALVRAGQAHLARQGIMPQVARAGVPAAGTAELIGDGISTTPDGLRELIEERLIITRLPGATEFPFLTRLVTPGGGGAGPIGEKKAIPARTVSFDLAGLQPAKFGALTVQSNEAVLLGGAPVARGLQNILVRDVTDSANAVALSSDAAVAGLAPAGLAHGAPEIAATSNLAAGVRALFEALGGGVDPASLCFVTDSLTAAELGTATDASGGLLFPNCGILGGEILGLPVLVTRSSPTDGSPVEGSLLLIDGSAVAYGLDEVSWSVAQSAALELSDDPTGDGDAPTAQSQQAVSLFQNDLTAFKATMRHAWKVTRAGAVAVLRGI